MDKAYIVANEQQEKEVLEKLEEKGALWGNGKNATNFIPFRTFPYVIYCNGDKYISWDKLGDLDVDKIIVYDGRKEDQMSEKYVVSQEFINELEEWKAGLNINGQYYVDDDDVCNLPNVIINWWGDDTHALEQNNRLIAIIRWVNGEDVFEVEKPKKWIVRSKETGEDDDFAYYEVVDNFAITASYNKDKATRFDTKKEAQSWANSHQEVVQAEVD